MGRSRRKGKLAKLPLWAKLSFVAVGLATLLAILVILTFTYEVKGTVTNIITKKPVKDVALSIGKHKSETDSNGGFDIKEIHLYEKKDLKVGEVVGYENKSSDIPISYKSHSVVQDVSLVPNAESTANYVSELQRFYQYDRVWELLHPDDQAYWGNKDTYVNLFSRAGQQLKDLGATTPTASLGVSRKLDSWTNPVTGKTYRDVTEIPVSFSTTALGIPVSQERLQHYIFVDGFFHTFSTVNREEVEKL